MKRRIAMWAGVGFLVACGWVLYTFVVPVEFLQESLRQPAVLAAAYVTCPLIFAGRHFAIYFWWFPPVNAATYALVGLVVEGLRRTARQQLAA